jgi:hypothetical protein
MKEILLTALVAGALVMPAAYGDRPRARERRQQARIAQGVKSGELSRQETKKLERREAKLHREIRRDRIDGGGLTPKERVKIEKKQDRLSRQIYREKHDNPSRK